MEVMYQNAFEADEETILRCVADRQSLSRREIEDYLRRQCLDYLDRRQEAWNPDYSSEEAFIKSVEPNRQHFREVLGVIGPQDDDLQPATWPAFENDRFVGQWLRVRLADGLHAYALYARPKSANGPLPLVIAQHGISSSPEHVFGFIDPHRLYHAFGMRLLEAGYAVLAPLLTTDAARRSRLDRLCRLLGFTLQGLEVAKISRLIDWAERQPEIDAGRIAMWGLSMGGLFTLITTPVELRIKAAIIAAFFNHRVNKMVVEDPRYSCFLPTNEEYIFMRGWLSAFSDRDLMALICPRPLQVQHGKCDAIAWWPQVVDEFEAGRVYYQALGVGDRCELSLHEGGHEIVPDEGIRFLQKWL